MDTAQALFRQRLRTHYRDLQVQYREVERGSPAWHDLDRALRATERLHVTLYREAIAPVHYAGGGSELPSEKRSAPDPKTEGATDEACSPGG